MCSIAGFYNNRYSYLSNEGHFKEILSKMNAVLAHRGPDENDIYLCNHFGMAHNRLSIIDIENGSQPMVKKVYGYTYGIAYNGELYNGAELRTELEVKGWEFDTNCDTEVILIGYLQYGADIVRRLNGIYAFAIMNEREDALYLFRDRMGVKPIYYTIRNNQVVFASEMKAIFEFPGIVPELDANGLNEIFTLGPSKTYAVKS